MVDFITICAERTRDFIKKKMNLGDIDILIVFIELHRQARNNICYYRKTID